MAGYLDQSNTNTVNDGHGVRYNTSSAYIRGGDFKPGITSTLEEVHLWLSKYNGPTNANFYVRIMTDDGTGKPSSTQVGGNSASVSSSSWATWTSTTEVTFSWSSNKPSLTINTIYWIVLDCDTTNVSTTSYFVTGESTIAGTGQTGTRGGNNGSPPTWGTLATRYFVYKTYMTDQPGGGSPAASGIMTLNRGWWGEQ